MSAETPTIIDVAEEFPKAVIQGGMRAGQIAEDIQNGRVSTHVTDRLSEAGAEYLGRIGEVTDVTDVIRANTAAAISVWGILLPKAYVQRVKEACLTA